MTIGSHQATIGARQDHLTPRWLLDRLGEFDTDPCAADPRPWDIATVNYTEADDGLTRDWQGRAWMNPPFNRFLIPAFVNRFVDHGHGTALVHVRTETEWFRPLWHAASAMLFLAGRVIFLKGDGTPCTITNPTSKHYGKAANSGAPVVLVACGIHDADVLATCGLDGAFVPLRLPRVILVAALEQSWREVLTEFIGQTRGPVALGDLYRHVARHPKARDRTHWREKIRQTLARGGFRRVGPALYEVTA